MCSRPIGPTQGTGDAAGRHAPGRWGALDEARSNLAFRAATNTAPQNRGQRLSRAPSCDRARDSPRSGKSLQTKDLGSE